MCKSQYLKEKQLKFLEETAKSIENDKTLKRAKKLGDRHKMDAEKKKVIKNI